MMRMFRFAVEDAAGPLMLNVSVSANSRRDRGRIGILPPRLIQEGESLAMRRTPIWKMLVLLKTVGIPGDVFCKMILAKTLVHIRHVEVALKAPHLSNK